jgi:hypothetical protein
MPLVLGAVTALTAQPWTPESTLLRSSTSQGAQAAAGAVGERPALSIVFLYDLTISVSYQPIARDEGLREVTKWLISDLQRGDSLRFGFVTTRLHLSRRFAATELTDFFHRVVQTTDVPDADRFGTSPLWDAMDAAVTAAATDPGRRAIIIMTDGRSTGNRLSVDDLVAHAKTAGVSIWPIDYAPSEWYLPDRAGRTDKPAELLKSIAAQTGGQYTPLPTPPSLTSLATAFVSIRGEMESRLRHVFEVLRR